MQYLFVARNMTKFPLMRGVRLWEVSVSRSSTVHTNTTFFTSHNLTPLLSDPFFLVPRCSLTGGLIVASVLSRASQISLPFFF